MQALERAYPVRPYRFLVDACVAKAGPLIPTSADRVLYLRDVGLLENASDAAIVERAAVEDAIIVTANGRDFLRAIDSYQRKEMRDQCHDLFGLVILPNSFANQERSVPRLAAKLRFGGSSITWRHVQINNLSVRLTDDGGVKIAALARCQYCLEFDPKRPMRKD
jgi:hypothetical protein